MTTAQISLLQAKYPDKVLAALDTRSTTLLEASAAKDPYRSIATVCARKARSRDTVDLDAFDEELQLLLHFAGNTLYYMPSGTDQLPVYITKVATTGATFTTFDVVREIAQAALVQSLLEQGSMKQGEARMFWMLNEEAIDPHPLIHATVVRERNECQVAVEIGRSNSGCYTSLFSVAIKLAGLKATPQRD